MLDRREPLSLNMKFSRLLLRSSVLTLLKEQIDDICRKSKEVWEKQAAARSKKESDKKLKRPLHQPVVVSRGSKSGSSRHHHSSEERGEGSRRHSGESRHGESSR